MDLQARAAIVRAHRCEIKQERQRQARGFAVLDTVGRAQGVVDRANAHNRRVTQANNQRNREVYGRIGERIDSHVEHYMEGRRARETARLRGVNTRNAERIRREGYEISPEFRRRSAAMARVQNDVSGSQRAEGHGISNRWRGATRQVGLDRNTRVTEDQRNAAILATRRQDPLDADPTSYNPPRRGRRNPPGELRTGRPQRRRN